EDHGATFGHMSDAVSIPDRTLTGGAHEDALAGSVQLTGDAFEDFIRPHVHAGDTEDGPLGLVTDLKLQITRVTTLEYPAARDFPVLFTNFLAQHFLFPFHPRNLLSDGQTLLRSEVIVKIIPVNGRFANVNGSMRAITKRNKEASPGGTPL